MLHPNQEGTVRYKRIHTGCEKYFHRFDELIMKPIFIYKYEKDMQKKSKEFFTMFMKQGQEIEQEFAQEQITNKQIREEGLKMAQFEHDFDKVQKPTGVATEYGKASSNAGFSQISRQFTKTRRKMVARKSITKLASD